MKIELTTEEQKIKRFIQEIDKPLDFVDDLIN